MSKQENKLKVMYENALEEFKESGYHPHPANLLAMLLLPEKDQFKPLRVTEGEFYKQYKSAIDSKIEKVITDFEISKAEIQEFIETKGVSVDNYEKDKIWFVFADGFGVMHGEMMYRPRQTSYQMYTTLENGSKLYKMTEYGLEEKVPTTIKNKVLSKNTNQ